MTKSKYTPTKIIPMVTRSKKYRNYSLVIGPFGSNYAKIVNERGDYVKWADEGTILGQLRMEPFTLNRRGTTIDLRVPFAEKNSAKVLGAKWDDYKKVWYIYPDNPNIDIMISRTNWITVAALNYCEAHKNSPIVHTTDDLEAYMQHRVTQGWDTKYDWLGIRYHIEREYSSIHDEELHL